MLGRLLYRFYKLSFLPGLILSAPIIFLLAWYLWSAYAQFDRYRRMSKIKESLTGELFQVFVHDEWIRDLRRLLLPDRPSQSKLPTISLSLDREALDQLNAKGAVESDDAYVKAYLQKDNHFLRASVRYRGQQYWHTIGAQKSMKIRVDKGELIDETRVFNLINDMTPFGLEEQIILDYARELGLLTPKYEPVWLRINNNDMGVYRFEEQPEEGLLRRGRRMPGSLYSVDTNQIDPVHQVGAAFFSRTDWQKVASRSEEDKEDFSELDAFLNAITNFNHQEFANFAATQLDLQKFALFDALDVIFGSNQHDYMGNQKFYFDLYTSKYEPIAWSFRGFQHDARFNFVDHPLLIRLKFTPGYLALRDQLIYRLLTEEISVASVRAKANLLGTAMLADLRADPYWDAYKILPRVDRFYRFMIRPMTTERWRLSAEAELRQFALRSRYLLNELEKTSFAVQGERNASGDHLTVSVSDHGAYVLDKIRLDAPCRGSFTFSENRQSYSHESNPAIAQGFFGEDIIVGGDSTLQSGLDLISRPDGEPKKGLVVAHEVPQQYLYELQSKGCHPQSGVVQLRNIVTDTTYRTRFDFVTDTSTSSTSYGASVGKIPHFDVGDSAPHTWAFATPAKTQKIDFGPGLVNFATSHTFSSEESVTFKPGTKVQLSAGVSLVFFGKLNVEGTAAQPVTIGAYGPKQTFQGILLQGPKTAGSTLRNLHIDGGSQAEYLGRKLPGLLNIHDTHDILIETLFINAAAKGEDAFHATYVRNLQINEAHIADPAQDGIDLEFVNAKLQGLKVTNAGDECVDLMASTLSIHDSVFAGCHANGLSAGEETIAAVHNVLLANTKTGVLSKNASNVRISRSLIFRSDTALRTNKKEVHYSTASQIGVNDLFAVECDNVSQKAKGTEIDTFAIEYELNDDALSYLKRQVLALENWNDLGSYVASIRKGTLP